MSNMKITAKEKLFIVIFGLFSISFFTPYLNYNLSNVINAGIFLLTAIIFFFVYSDTRKLSCVPIVYVCYALLMLQMLLYKALDISTCSWNHVYMNFFIYFIFVIAYGFVSRASIKAQHITILIVSIIFIVNVIDNIYLLYLYPTASSDLNFEWGTAYYNMNVGGSTFVMLSSMMALFFLMCFLTANRKRMLMLFGYFLSTVYIIMSARAISVLTLIIGSLALLLLRFMDNMERRARQVVYFIILMLMLLGVFALPSLFDWLSTIIKSERLSIRIAEISYLLRNGVSSLSDSSGSLRIELYLLSIKTMFSSISNFLFGIGEHPSVISQLNAIGLGGHSALLDFAAEYGIIGVVLLLTIFRIVYRTSYSSLPESKEKNMGKMIFFMFLINSVMNNALTIPCLITVIVLIPSYIKTTTYDTVNNL